MPAEQTEAPAETPEEVYPEAAPTVPATEAPEEPAETPAPETPAEPAYPTGAEAAAAARQLIGADVSRLYAAIGMPGGSDYAPSCLVDGDDGELYYDGFTVYTQRTADGETVYDVE